jgi:Tfp pilus assembly pilus retraction ATPase PilT
MSKGIKDKKIDLIVPEKVKQGVSFLSKIIHDEKDKTKKYKIVIYEEPIEFIYDNIKV